MDGGGGVGLGAPAEERPQPREAKRTNNTVAVVDNRRALQGRRPIDRVIIIWHLRIKSGLGGYTKTQRLTETPPCPCTLSSEMVRPLEDGVMVKIARF